MTTHGSHSSHSPSSPSTPSYTLGSSTEKRSFSGSSADSGMVSTSGSSLSSKTTSIPIELHRKYVKWGKMRKFVYSVVHSNVFGGCILFIILLNTVLIALQTDSWMERNLNYYFAVTDSVFLGVYLFEMLAKLYALRGYYFKEGWNIFDFFIVLVSFTDYLRFILASLSTLDPKIFRFLRVFRAVRAVRALRVLRSIRFLRSLQVIVHTLLKSIPALSSIVFLLFLVMYIFAIIGRALYSELIPENFGSILVALFTLFQLITLDDWFEIYEKGREQEPSMLAYLIVFIIFETFVFINLFIAVIVNNMQASAKQQKTARAGRISKLLKRRKNQDQQKKDHNFQSKVENPDLATERLFASQGGVSKMPVRLQQLVLYYYMLLAALENNMDYHSSQKRILNDLVGLLKAKDGSK